MLRERLQLLINTNDQIVSWLEWDTVKSANPKTGEEIIERQEIWVTGVPSDLIADTLTEVEFQSRHTFEAQ